MAQKKVDALEEKLAIVQEEWQKEMELVRDDTKRIPAFEKTMSEVLSKLDQMMGIPASSTDELTGLAPPA